MAEREKERTERAGDPQVSAAYRELGAEKPPRALDDAILAAARREAGGRPGAPGRGARNRWYAPLAAAAVLVLAVAVTLLLPAAIATNAPFPTAYRIACSSTGAEPAGPSEPRLRFRIFAPLSTA